MAESYIGQLDPNTPPGTAYLSTVDEVLRLVKKACHDSFPNVTGAVNLSHTQLNALPSDITSAQTALKNVLDPHAYTTLGGGIAATVVPKGAIMMWNHNVGSIPTGWRLCDGGTYNSVITPDLRGRFIIGETTGFGAGTRPLAEAATISTVTGHTHTVTVDGHALTTDEIPNHAHNVPVWTSGGTTPPLAIDDNVTARTDTGSRAGSVPTDTDGGGGTTGDAHSHTGSSGSGGSHTHTATGILPIRYVLAFICYCGG